MTATAPNVPLYEWLFGSFTMFEGQPAGAGGKPFFSNPSDCAEQAATAPLIRVSSNTWEQRSNFSHLMLPQPPVTGCENLEFGTPDVPVGFTFQPSTDEVAAGTGATAHLHIDQSGLTDPNELATPHLKKSVVTLPAGLTLNPSAANGLQTCTTQQMGLITTEGAMPNPIRFDKEPVACPDGSKIGTAKISTPLLEEELEGTVYLAAQNDNPFHSLLAIYVVVESPRFGITVKLPGEVRLDSKTGQITATFDDNPQLPFEDLTLDIRGGGPHSNLATPDVCGKYTTHGEWTPWSAPESGPPAQTEDSFEVTGAPGCPTTKAARPFDPGFSAGTENAAAGRHSPFLLDLTRPDGDQEIERVEVSTPPGFAATFKGVATCSDAQVAAAQAPGRTGAAELAHPSCPAQSQVGSTSIGVGVGPDPYYVNTGRAYLTGPYKGAPLSLTFIVPAVAGPFDLGVQVVRTAVEIDPQTAQATAISDPIPTILEGIPVLIRDIRVNLDRSDFTLNPTSCEPMQVGARVSGNSGAGKNLSSRFQVGGCGDLPFAPKLALRLDGGTKRGGHPALHAVLTAKEGEANIGRAAVTLPHSEFLDQAHIRTICTRVQFRANACPEAAIYGHAIAYTPLLDSPLEGPVYLRSSDNKLPDLVAALRGPDSQPIEVELDGTVDSVNGGIRNRFELVPDAPVSKFVLDMQGGRKGLLVNSRDICARPYRATVKMTGQNGKLHDFRPLLRNGRCGKEGRKQKRHRERR